MSSLLVHSVRGDVVETTHHVAAAVVSAAGHLVASSGDSALVTPARSAAKPFQAFPLAADGVDVSGEELALSCASHNGEQPQVDRVVRWLQRLGRDERDLVCGPHRSLAVELGFRAPDGSWPDVTLAPRSRVASNCSGKHVGMLALAGHHGWPTTGYGEVDHPVQERGRASLAEWCDLAPASIGAVGDGCGVVAWTLPLRALAHGYARLAAADGAMAQLRAAMMAHPHLVAGHRRSCTALMEAYPGRLVAKVGAGGVYAAALVDRGWGIAVKTLDGDPRAATVALVHLLGQLDLPDPPSRTVPQLARPVVVDTNTRVVGHLEAHGTLTVHRDAAAT